MWEGGQQQAFRDALKIKDVEGAMAIWCRTVENYLLDLTEERTGTPWEPEKRKRLRRKGEGTQNGDEVTYGNITKEDAREWRNNGRANYTGQYRGSHAEPCRRQWG